MQVIKSFVDEPKSYSNLIRILENDIHYAVTESFANRGFVGDNISTHYDIRYIQYL